LAAFCNAHTASFRSLRSVVVGEVANRARPVRSASQGGDVLRHRLGQWHKLGEHPGNGEVGRFFVLIKRLVKGFDEDGFDFAPFGLPISFPNRRMSPGSRLFFVISISQPFSLLLLWMVDEASASKAPFASSDNSAVNAPGFLLHSGQREGEGVVQGLWKCLRQKRAAAIAQGLDPREELRVAVGSCIGSTAKGR
jgi:hypothetical protein